MNLPFYELFKSLHEKEFSYSDFDTTDYALYVALAVLSLTLALLFIWLIYGCIYSYFDNKKATTDTIMGSIIDRRYVGEQSTYGTGTAVMPNTTGGIGVGLVSTSSYSEEEFLFFIKADKVYKAEVDMQQFYQYNIGDKITFQVKKGGLSNDELNVFIS